MAFDPGDKNNGFCMFAVDQEKPKADLRIKTILDPSALHSMLKVLWGTADTDDTRCVFVVENFRVDTMARGRTNQMTFQWNEVKTSRVIGKIELIADWTGSEIVYQEPRVLDMGKRWCDFKVNKSHIQDDVSAYIHGAYYLMRNELVQTVEDISKFGQETM